MSLLMIKNLYGGYGKKDVVTDVSLEIEKGQIVGILGPNGCGKSTLMKTVCNGISYRGEIKINDVSIKDLSEKELAKKCSYVPQRSGLSIDISVFDAVMMGFHPYLGILEMPNKEMKSKALNILEEIGLKDYITANYMELSEGQKRLVILARSMVAESELLLMDEPDGALDFGMKNKVLRIALDRLAVKKGGALLTLHDVDLAFSYCSKVYLMKDGRFIGVICPKKDDRTEMESKLSDLYGKVRLLEYEAEDSEKRLIMVRA